MRPISFKSERLVLWFLFSLCLSAIAFLFGNPIHIGVLSIPVPLSVAFTLLVFCLVSDRLLAKMEGRLQKMVEERDYWSAFLDSSAEGVLVWDRQGQVKYLNEVAKEILHIKRSDVNDQHVSHFLKLGSNRFYFQSGKRRLKTSCPETLSLSISEVKSPGQKRYYMAIILPPEVKKAADIESEESLRRSRLDESNSAKGGDSSKHILLIDDLLSDPLKDLLISQGFQVSHFESAEEALRIGLDRVYGLSLVSMQLKDVDSFELIAKLCRKKISPQVFAISYRASDLEREEALLNGASLYFERPKDYEKILQSLSSLKADRRPVNDLRSEL